MISSLTQAALSEVFTERCTIPGYGETRGIVSFTEEFRRIEALPRKGEEDVEDLVEFLTNALCLSGEMRLRPLQALALKVLYDTGGLLGALPVGSGKTLITFLAGSTMQAVAPVLLIPAHLRDKTERDFDDLEKHWDVSMRPLIRTYQWLGRSGAADWLDEYRPDLIIADEAHRLRNPGSACARRVFRYLRENPAIPFCALSGTLLGRSLRDIHKLSALALGPDMMPLPHDEKEVRMWSRAVDEKVDIRTKPGALGMFLEKDEPPSLPNIRKAVGRRIFETPGVLATFTEDVTASITINPLKWPMPAEVKDHVSTLLDFSQAPNGDECTPADVYRHLRSLALGFYYEWDPTPPWEWLDARRHWKRFAREVLEAENPLYDSEFQVANAAKQGLLDPSQWHAWDAVRHSYNGESVPVWVSDEMINRIMKHVGPDTLIWVEQIAVGEYLSECTGWPYYHNQGRDRSGNFIDDHGDGPLIASIAANSEGRNLQAWSKALIVTPPASGKICEQLLGRMHRPGQTADEVHVDVLIPHTRIRQQFRQAIRDAELVRDMTKQPQKLLIADYTEAI